MACILGPKIYAPVISALAVVAGLVLPTLFVADTSGCLSSVGTVLPIELGTVLAVTAFRHHLKRLWRNTQEARDNLLEVQQRAALTNARATVRAQRLQAVVAAIEPLMVGISLGHLDAQDQEVREQAGQAETTLRSLLLLDDRLGELGNVIAQFVADAHNFGSLIRVVSGEFVPDPTPGGMSGISSVLSDVLTQLTQNIDVTIGLFVRESQAVLTLVISGAVVGMSIAADAYAELDVEVHRTAEEMLLEVSWQMM